MLRACCVLPILLAVISLAPVRAQTSAFPLENLQITRPDGSPTRIKTERIVAVIGLKIGQPVTKASFDVARERLLASGAFENVGYEFKPSAKKTGYDVKFELMEVLQMYPYRFEDLPAPDDKLRAAITNQEGIFDGQIPFIPGVIDSFEKILAKVVDNKVEVHGGLNYSNPDQPVIVFRPPGDAPRISEVQFMGNSVLTTEQLAARFIQVAFGSEYTEAKVRALLAANITPMYEAKGRLRVAYPKVSAATSTAPEVVAVSVSVSVEEGPEFKLGAIAYAGIDLKDAKLKKEIDSLTDFRTNETANFDDIEKSLERLRQRYRRRGYVHVNVQAERTLRESTVDLLVKIEPGPQFVYGKLDIKGLDILSEPPLRQMWGERTGKPFDPTFPDAFLKEIMEDRLFDNLRETKSQTKLNEDNKTADVTLVFTGGQPNSTPTRRQPGQR